MPVPIIIDKLISNPYVDAYTTHRTLCALSLLSRFIISSNLNCRSLRYDHSIRNHMNNQKNVPPSELPLPQTSTLRSRRRLANMLVASSFVFVFCWAPHIICLIWSKLTATEVCSKAVTSYCLLLGKYDALET